MYIVCDHFPFQQNLNPQMRKVRKNSATFNFNAKISHKLCKISHGRNKRQNSGSLLSSTVDHISQI